MMAEKGVIVKSFEELRLDYPAKKSRDLRHDGHDTYAVDQVNPARPDATRSYILI
jgi:hypothetical protein